MSRLERARGLLERRWAPAATILLALLLVSPSLKAGLVADDFIHRLRLDPSHRLAGFDPAPLDLRRSDAAGPAPGGILRHRRGADGAGALPPVPPG